MGAEKKYHPLVEAESRLGLKAGTLISLGAQGMLAVYAFADNWLAHVWATPSEAILEEHEAELHVTGHALGESRMVSPPNAPALLNGPVRLTPESIARFEVQSPAPINAFMLPEVGEGDYPQEYESEYRLIDPANPALPKNVQIDKIHLFVMQADFKELSEQHPPDWEKPISETERKSLYKLIIGMAIGGYKYDPSKAKNTATHDIHTDLGNLGIELDEDTIRKWLKESAQLLPFQKASKK